MEADAEPSWIQSLRTVLNFTNNQGLDQKSWSKLTKRKWHDTKAKKA